ncbi:MAG: methyl-accepting chemotaxis protein [Microcystaceae cyanobacterium]
MSPGKDYSKLYGQAYVAYGQGSYQEAAGYIEEMGDAYPNDPNVLLLEGHINVGLRQYDQARVKYQAVLNLTDRQDLRDCADQALVQIQELSSDLAPQSSANPRATAPGVPDEDDFIDDADFSQWQAEEQEGWSGENDFDGLDWDSALFNAEEAGEPTLGQDRSTQNPFGEPPTNNPMLPTGQTTNPDFEANPFALNDVEGFVDWDADDFMSPQEDGEEEKTLLPGMGESTFVVPSDIAAQQQVQSAEWAAASGKMPSWMGDVDETELPSLLENELVPTVQSSPPSHISAKAKAMASQTLTGLDDFNVGDLDNLGDFDLTDIAPELPDSALFSQGGGDRSRKSLGGFSAETFTEDMDGEGLPTMATTGTPPGMATWLKPSDSLGGEMAGASSRYVKPTVEVDPGWLGWFTNAPLKRKQWYVAIATGATAALTVLIFNGVLSVMAKPSSSPPPTPPKVSTGKPAKPPAQTNPKRTPESSAPSIFLVALFTGISTFATTWLISHLFIRQIRRTIDDLQNQFDAIYEGNFNVRAKVYSEDELGQLAQRFNYISQVILTATSEAQERASATEKAREKLQRQVIRLLDDVEGASRGDLTVQAEVTADELGAVADAFNLTIQNLREIVLQVKKAAKQVNRNCTDSEAFARNNSSDALRMAEELAVTLNSVQLMTESIQRVAENATEAEEVAHTSSLTALKGGESLERTVAGILQIRETVSETARKVKRLAEASQEISKIVAVISQIASRTNLLALNASIQAARAGEAGRGFAIVADEVRQLADRSAKSLKEIEQIVLQIQSETGSVMTAMEEGIQQVIDVTDKSEQSKRALEDIIEVSNRINTLVRSITADTVKQQENSGAVGQVMQSIELTAQETSQESQRVAGSLGTLVSISQDLLTSVERFRLEKSQK